MEQKMNDGNRLEEWIAGKEIDPVKAMNRLQEYAIVSDNCISIADVAAADHERAVQFLSESPLTNHNQK